MSVPRPAPRSPGKAGVWRGTVVRVAADGRPYVTVARLSRGTTFGPCDVLEGPWSSGLDVTAGGAGPHTHGAGADLAAGDRVLVAPLEGRPDEVVVLGRLRP